MTDAVPRLASRDTPWLEP